MKSEVPEVFVVVSEFGEEEVRKLRIVTSPIFVQCVKKSVKLGRNLVFFRKFSK